MDLIENKREIHLSFDLDGTLINSLPLMRSSWAALCEKHSLKIGWSLYKKQIGLPFHVICKNLGVGALAEELEYDYFSYNLANASMIEPMPGLESLVNWLAEREVEWSIITSKPKVTAIPILEKFLLNPVLVICSDDSRKGKPYSEPAEILKTRVSENRVFYYIGDSIVDQFFAVNSSFTYIGFSPAIDMDYDLSPPGAGKILNPVTSISSLSEIPELFN